MEHCLQIDFPGASQVSVTVGAHRIVAENPSSSDSPQYPSPFELFLASIVTCSASYARAFCDARNLPTKGLGLSMAYDRSPEQPQIKTLRLSLRLPDGFPEKYHAGIVRAIDQCAVKKHLVQAPEFDVVLEEADCGGAGD